MKKLMLETDPRFQQLQKKVGIFILLSLFVGLSLFVAIKRDLFITQYSVYFTSYRGRGITEGMPVKLSGFKIGKINSITLDEQGLVKAQMAINKKYIKWINKKSIAWLIKEGLFGSYIIEISPGPPSLPVENNDTLEFDKAKELEDLVDELKPTLEEIQGIISYLNNPEGDVKTTIGNIRQLSRELFVTRQNLDKILSNANQEVVGASADIKALSRELNNTAQNLNKAVTTVNQDLPQIMSDISKSAANIEKLSRNINKTWEQSGDKIPSAINKIESAADDTQEILEGAKRSWPVKNLVEPPQEKVIKGDSYE